MKTTGSKDAKAPKAPSVRREESLYPNLGELKRLDQVYKKLGLDYGVLRATPPEEKTRRRC